MLATAIVTLVNLLSQGQYEATASYKTLRVEGFDVRVSKAALQAKADCDPAIALLRLRLNEVARRVPKDALQTLRTVPIWVELDDKLVKGMCYHPDVQWLKENGMNPDKAQSVEIGSIKAFVEWSIDQPMMVLHEYAHAYHHKMFGFEGTFILDAYRHAMDAHLYDQVRYYRGRTDKAYAATNQQEYFAELSEAFFGYNDFFPFTRPELEQHDPVGFEMVKKAWGVP